MTENASRPQLVGHLIQIRPRFIDRHARRALAAARPMLVRPRDMSGGGYQQRRNLDIVSELTIDKHYENMHIISTYDCDVLTHLSRGKIMKNMKSQLRNRAIPLSILAALCAQPLSPSFAQQPSAVASNPACTFPTTPAGSREELAWRMFTAAMCPIANGPLTFETWTEQFCWYNPTNPACSGSGVTKTRVLHGSALKSIKKQNNLSAECQPMTTVSPSSPLNPFVPKNLAATAQFCEEVFVNQAEAAFITRPPGAAVGVNLLTSTGQAAYISSKGPLTLPTAALEIKADWLPAASLKSPNPSTPAFTCSGKDKLQGVYTETIAGTCYALVGIHISSKLFPNWLWATFEPQSSVTNPNRCNPKLYSGCNDPWGSNPAKSTGKPTAPTPRLNKLMLDAKLAPEFLNYRLVGVQKEVTDPPLGNSFVEFNADVPPHQASCITCHTYAAINTATSPPGHGSGGGTPATGKPSKLPTGWVPLDFSWLLGFMPSK